MNKLAHLEGLRGLAALVVLMCHVQLGFWPNLYTDMSAALPPMWWFWNAAITWAYASLLDGRLAVFVFWVMSAYVLSRGLFWASDARPYLVAATAKRYFRLAGPCLVIVLLVCAIMKVGPMPSTRLGPDLAGLRALFLFAPDWWGALNFGLWEVYFAYPLPPHYNHVLWSIEYEMYGSLGCFALFALVGRWRYRWLVYAVAAIALFWARQAPYLSFWMGFVLCDYDHLHSPTRAWAWVQQVEQRLWANRYWPVALLAVLAIWGKLLLFVVGRTGGDWANLAQSSLLFYLVLRVRAVWPWLTSRPVAWLGKVSFSLYLVHQPLICLLGAWVYLQSPARWAFVAACSVSVLASLGVAAFYWRWVDLPILRWANAWGRWVAARLVPTFK
jgi:peptidoglycan/LPS O-acetylase OafA/YrhL